jgi:hypothetical protein
MPPTWREQVIEAVHESAAVFGADPHALLESVSFVESLDPLVDLDGEPLAHGVAQAVREATAPYGDVTYADPGYRDKRKRYPVDTEAHARAAWSYINQKDNAAQYTAEQLSAIKGRIKAALKRFGVAVSASEADDVDLVEVENDEEDDEQDGDATQEAAHDRIAGRVLEARGTDESGGRVFNVRIIAFGDSRNGRRYPARVMQGAVSKYEGARAYDHHRTAEELRSSTLTGLIGSYRNVEARSDGLYGDLHLLPGATHAAEALDATLAAQEQGRPPIVGVSHDVMAHFQPINNNGRRLQEATQIVDVQSADVVANPSAGGLAVRAVAGGTETEEESDVPTKADVLAAFKEATDDELAAVGLSRAPSNTTESVAPPTRAVESGQGERSTEAMEYDKTSFIGQLLVKEKLAAANLTPATEAAIVALPERFTEADVDNWVRATKDLLAHEEVRQLKPTVTAEVVRESMDKKVAALDAMFAGDFQKGYKSFREAYLDFTGYRPAFLDTDLNRKILRESFAPDYEYQASRATESLSSSSWNLVLGDSITRRLVAEYNEPSLMDWQRIVSSMPPVNDFRTQRIERIGGYGVLPAVAQGAPYQPLTSPGNEEVTYALAKKGGTEDVTLETIANDDIRSISKIPTRLALAAKRTIFGFVFELIRPVAAGASYMGTTGNPTIYDSTALYAAGHNNTATNALSQTNLSAARAAMRKQAGYGDTTNVLSATPRLLLVPPTLEELAYQLCTSAVAIPATPAGAANTPNIHQGLDYVVIDYWDALSSTQWAVVADPNSIPTVEVGFYQGQRDPQLFTQSDQTVGSMFNADKFTYKIRHIYSGAVLDFRGFYRGNS